MNKPEISNGWYIFRFALIFLLSIVVMLSDIKLKVMSDFRYYLETALYPVMVFADSPRSITDAVTEQFKSREALISENEQLARELYTQRADLLRLKSLELENAHMRKLLNTPLQETSKRMVGIVLDVNIDPYLKRVVINRGTGSGVYVGMPVITEKGLVGQVISANYASSQVLLLIDSVSSVPVMNLRSQIRAIASGVGVHDLLSIDNVPLEVAFSKPLCLRKVISSVVPDFALSGDVIISTDPVLVTISLSFHETFQGIKLLLPSALRWYPGKNFSRTVVGAVISHHTTTSAEAVSSSFELNGSFFIETKY